MSELDQNQSTIPFSILLRFWTNLISSQLRYFRITKRLKSKVWDLKFGVESLESKHSKFTHFVWEPSTLDFASLHDHCSRPISQHKSLPLKFYFGSKVWNLKFRLPRMQSFISVEWFQTSISFRVWTPVCICPTPVTSVVRSNFDL